MVLNGLLMCVNALQKEEKPWIINYQFKEKFEDNHSLWPQVKRFSPSTVRTRKVLKIRPSI